MITLKEQKAPIQIPTEAIPCLYNWTAQTTSPVSSKQKLPETKGLEGLAMFRASNIAKPLFCQISETSQRKHFVSLLNQQVTSEKNPKCEMF